MAATVVFLALTYLMAAVPFGVVVTTLYGGDVDLRAAGSGNIGTTNVARVFGWRIAAWVLALDMSKGFLPVLLAWAMWPERGPTWLAVVTLVAFAGHCWPVYLEFRGGKGVATAAGAMLAIAPLPTLLTASVWGLVFAAGGRASVAALTATIAMIGIVTLLRPDLTALVCVLAVAVIVRHLANIGRLMRGEEQEVIRPVRWGRRAAQTVSAEEVMLQDPGGGHGGESMWKTDAERSEHGSPRDV